MHHSLKNGRVFHTWLRRVSTGSVTIEYMFGQPRESVRMPRLGLALMAAIVKATGDMVLSSTCLVGKAVATALIIRCPLASVMCTAAPSTHHSPYLP